MPVDFLTEDQRQRYGRYVGEPSPEQLDRYFHLSDSDREVIGERRGDHNRLGFALQLCTLRFLGLFLVDPLAVPVGAIRYVATQLGITDLAGLSRYAERIQTQQEHTLEIRRRFGYLDWSDPGGGFALLRMLYAREWVSAERPSLLFDLAITWLLDHKVVLPGITTLERLIARVREQVAERVFQRLSLVPTPAQRSRLERLLERSGASRMTTLERLRRAPSHASSNTLVAALARLEEIRALVAGMRESAGVSPNRLKALATYAVTSKAALLERLPPARRTATLYACARYLEGAALDDALDVLDLLLHGLLARSERTGTRQRLRTLRDLDAAALRLAQQVEQVLSEEWSDDERLAYLTAQQASLQASIATIYTIARPPDDHYYQELEASYTSVRRFLPHVLASITFRATPAGQPVLDALTFLRSLEGVRRPVLEDAPLEFVPAGWRRYVVKADGTVDRRYYTLCALTRLHDLLRRREVFVPGSRRWGDPRAQLLQGDAWERARATVCQSLGRSLTPQSELAELAQQLDDAYRRTAALLPSETTRIEQVTTATGQEETQVVFSPLERIPEPESLQRLRLRVQRRLPAVDLPELLLEIHLRTGFADEFTHVSESRTRLDDLPTSLCAVLLAEACNIGLAPVTRQGVPALERGRLSYVQQNYVRPETLSRANARLVDYQATIPLASAWGGGEVASADGLRFVVPVRTLNAGPNPKYFGTGRGLTLINYTSDQFSGFKHLVVPGTLRDSLFVLEGLLTHETKLPVRELMTDTASYSDVVFGLFYLLGYQFSPRLADMGDRRWWRMDPAADYGVLNAVAAHTINQTLIARNWEDMLRVAGSLKMGTVSAIELMRALHRDGHPSTLARAIGELGCIPKTLHMLACVDEAERRRLLVQLNKGESRHSLARRIFHGHKGEVRQRYREGQEEQLSALGLVMNAIILWNTLYMDRVLEELCSAGMTILPEDIARLSPIGHEHINVYGKYSFTLAESIRAGAFHPLREVEAATEEEPLQEVGEETFGA
jgi:TnpA family transposase